MDNENLVLEIKHENWSLTAPGFWQYTIWKIYGDLKLNILISNGIKKDLKTESKRISQKEFDVILDLLRKSEKDDEKVEALDGSAWEIKRYQGKSLVWERKMGYIYGVKSLEALSKFLYKMTTIKEAYK